MTKLKAKAKKYKTCVQKLLQILQLYASAGELIMRLQDRSSVLEVRGCGRHSSRDQDELIVDDIQRMIQ